jgi:hypothetical protein
MAWWFSKRETEHATHGRPIADRDPYEGFRLLILLLLIGGSIVGIIWISQRPIEPSPDATKTLADALRAMQGLSPGIQACYTVRSTTSSIIIAAGFGISLGVTYLFGNFLYRKFRDSVAEEREKFWSGVAARLNLASGAELSEIVLGFTHYEQIILDRRNLYWSLFLRATLALLVVAVIALLISVCKIESQAGLPIITGIIAFIIGQHSDILHGSGPSISGTPRPAAPPVSSETQAGQDQPAGGANAPASAGDGKQTPVG